MGLSPSWRLWSSGMRLRAGDDFPFLQMIIATVEWWHQDKPTQVCSPEPCARQSRRRFGNRDSSTGSGLGWSQLVQITQQAPEHLRFYTLVSCIFFLVAKSKSNQNKRPSQHLNNSQCSARRANNCVQGSWCWLNEEFSASGFTQGHEDQQTTNRAEPLQAAEGRKPARGCSCTAAWPRSVPWPARSPKPHQPPHLRHLSPPRTIRVHCSCSSTAACRVVR